VILRDHGIQLADDLTGIIANQHLALLRVNRDSQVLRIARRARTR
jgi:hypothetical protein